jgi:hypothetical protein
VAICSDLGGDRRFFTATTWWYDAGDAVLVQTFPRARPAELLAAHRAGLDHLAARGLVAAPFGEGVRATVVADHARFGAVVTAHPWRLTGRLLLASLLRRQPFRGPIAGRPDAAARIALWQGVLR